MTSKSMLASVAPTLISFCVCWSSNALPIKRLVADTVLAEFVTACVCQHGGTLE